MKALYAKEIARILGCDFHGENTEIAKVSTDSRKVDEKTLFVALKGEKFDGHQFIRDVLDKGAPLAVGEFVPEGADPAKVLIVPDTLKAFGKLGQYNRRQFKGTLIALTGSSGKTTTKEELKTMLQQFAPTYATSGNFNNFIGVPRSLLDIDLNARYAVIEMGMSAKGEIEYLSGLAEPNVAIVINVYPMHIEFLGSLENIARAKAEIFQGLRSGGIALYNADTSFTDILQQEAEKYADKVYSYGKDSLKELPFLPETASETDYANARCVLKTAEILGLDATVARNVVSRFSAPEGRGSRHQLNINDKHILLIDDSYSGQPEAMKLAIRALGKLAGVKRRIAVLGKMAELGDYSRQAHIEVGKELAQNGIDVVIGICAETKDILAQLPEQTEKYYFEDFSKVTEFLTSSVLKDGDALLIKGAHYSSQVFRIATALKTYENAA